MLRNTKKLNYVLNTVTYSHGYESFMYMTFIAVLFRPKANVAPIDGSIYRLYYLSNVAIATKPIGVRRRRPTRL